MKKYVKPELFYERYELTEQVAACSWDAYNQMDENNCAFEGDKSTGLEGLFAFADSTKGCDFVPEQYCYQPGADGYNSFNS